MTILLDTIPTGTFPFFPVRSLCLISPFVDFRLELTVEGFL